MSDCICDYQSPGDCFCDQCGCRDHANESCIEHDQRILNAYTAELIKKYPDIEWTAPEEPK